MLIAFLFKYSPGSIAGCLFILMIASLYLGFRLSHNKKESAKDLDKTSGSLINGLFGLSAFLLGFTFSMSAARYESRRTLLVEEANNIGTAILRTDLYPDSVRQQLRGLLKEYVDLRIAYYDIKGDTTALNASFEAANRNSAQIWKLAVDFSKKPNALIATNQMVPALNAMIDITTTRQQQIYAMVPESIVIMLFILTIASAFLAGYMNSNKKIDWPVAVSFCFLSAIVIFITLDLDRPKRGLITLDQAQKAMIELRKNF